MGEEQKINTVVDMQLANINEINNESTDSDNFIDESNADAFKLLSLKSKVNDINSVMENITNEQSKLVDDDDFSFIDKRIESLSEEDIKKLDNKAIDDILTDDDGCMLAFTIDFGKDVNALYKFKKEFLILRKQSLETFAKFDEELAKINAEIAESQEEFERFSKEFGNVSNLIRSTLVNKLENADTDRKKELFEKLITSFDNAITLDNVKAYCKSYRGNSVISDYRDDKKAQYIYRRYLKVVEKLNINTKLTTFTNLEKRFLDNEYHRRPNIFVFAVIHYISSWHNKEFTKADGLFVTQFAVNLKNLYYNKFDDVNDKNTFINNIESVIKIIG